MLTSAQLTGIARARIKDAAVLLSRRRFDACVYLSVYAVEAALKARIIRSLRWAGFPDSPNEWKGMGSLKTHDFEILLSFTRRRDAITVRYAAEWSVVRTWQPELRYVPVGSATLVSARVMFESARSISRAL